MPTRLSHWEICYLLVVTNFIKIVFLCETFAKPSLQVSSTAKPLWVKLIDSTVSLIASHPVVRQRTKCFLTHRKTSCPSSVSGTCGVSVTSSYRTKMRLMLNCKVNPATSLKIRDRWQHLFEDFRCLNSFILAMLVAYGGRSLLIAQNLSLWH